MVGLWETGAVGIQFCSWCDQHPELCLLAGSQGLEQGGVANPNPGVDLVSYNLGVITPVAFQGQVGAGASTTASSGRGRAGLLALSWELGKEKSTYLLSSFSQQFSECPKKNLQGRKRGQV